MHWLKNMSSDSGTPARDWRRIFLKMTHAGKCTHIIRERLYWNIPGNLMPVRERIFWTNVTIFFVVDLCINKWKFRRPVTWMTRVNMNICMGMCVWGRVTVTPVGCHAGWREYYSLPQFTNLYTLSCRPRDGLHNLSIRILLFCRIGNRGPHRWTFGWSTKTGHMMHVPEWADLIDLPTITPILKAIFGNSSFFFPDVLKYRSLKNPRLCLLLYGPTDHTVGRPPLKLIGHHWLIGP